jgi:hypothetical protein
MIRPMERFAVRQIAPEIEHDGKVPGAWAVSRPLLVVLAVVVGAGLGGLLPVAPARLDATLPGMVATLDEAMRALGIEPAAGSGDAQALVVQRAPDGAFYLAAALNQMPMTVRLEPARATSRVGPMDAARLVPGTKAGARLRLAELALGPRRTGPLELEVGGPADAPPVLGADALAAFGVVEIDGQLLRLLPR